MSKEGIYCDFRPKSPFFAQSYYTRAGGYSGYVAIEFVLTTARPSLEAKLIKRNGNRCFIFIAQNIENIP